MISNTPTNNEIAFCNLVAAGSNYTDAYRQATGTKGNPKVVNVDATRFAKKPRVVKLLAALRERDAEKESEKRVASKQSKRELLFIAMTDEEVDWNRRLKAIEVDNAMTGENAPQEVHMVGLKEIMRKVREGSN
jgi:hypothetical protein